MATVVKGTVATTEVLQDSMVIDMREEVSMADTDETQFSTFTMKSKSGTATREKINWREKEYFPRLVTAAATFTNAALSVTLTAGHGARVRAGDVLRSQPMGDALYVQSVAGDVLTVVRNIGVKAAQAGSIGDTLLITSNAQPQGADFPETAILQATLGYNYTQILRHGYTFARTAQKVDYYGKSEPAQESTLKAIEHKRAIEYSGFWGARDFKTTLATAAMGALGEPTGVAGGLVEYITSNRYDVLSTAITVDGLDTFLQQALQKSSRNIAFYVAPLLSRQISKFNRGGQGTAWRAEPQNVAGLKVDAFMSGVYGYEIPVVVKKDWNDFPVTLKQFGGWGFIVDHDRVEFKTLTDSGTKLLTARQHPGADRVSEEYLTEFTWEIRNEASHALVFGVA